MSKSLENEYRQAVISDIPDLWGRIEKEIDLDIAKKQSETESVVQSPVNIESKEDCEIKSFTEKRNKRIKTKKIISIISTVAALLLVMVLGAFVFKGVSGRNIKSETPQYFNFSESMVACDDVYEAEYVAEATETYEDYAACEEDTDTLDVSPTAEATYEDSVEKGAMNMVLEPEVEKGLIRAIENGAVNSESPLSEEDETNAIVKVISIDEYVGVQYLVVEIITCDDFEQETRMFVRLNSDYEGEILPEEQLEVHICDINSGLPKIDVLSKIQ